MGAAGVRDVEEASVAGEGEAVGPDAVGDDGLDLAARGVDPVDMAGADLALGAFALVVAVDAVGGIGEPDGAVGGDRRVVGRIEPPAPPVARQHGARAVMLDAADAARQVLAGDQPALPVHGVAVVVAAALPEHGDRAVRLVEAHQPVIGDVRPQEIAPGGKVGRALRPARAVHSRSSFACPMTSRRKRGSRIVMSPEAMECSPRALRRALQGCQAKPGAKARGRPARLTPPPARGTSARCRHGSRTRRRQVLSRPWP